VAAWCEGFALAAKDGLDLSQVIGTSRPLVPKAACSISMARRPSMATSPR
jgi:hypothetical protein